MTLVGGKSREEYLKKVEPLREWGLSDAEIKKMHEAMPHWWVKIPLDSEESHQFLHWLYRASEAAKSSSMSLQEGRYEQAAWIRRNFTGYAGCELRDQYMRARGGYSGAPWWRPFDLPLGSSWEEVLKAATADKT